MNTWNTLPESYQQRVYNNTVVKEKRQIQQVENPTPAVVISTEAVRVDKALPLHYLTSEVALEEPEIRSTDPNILIDTICRDDALHFGMPGSCGDYEDEGDERDMHDAIRTASRQRLSATELQRFHMGTSDVDGYEGEDGDNVDGDADEEDEASQPDDGSTQNVEN
jgi:hypothetical protein